MNSNSIASARFLAGWLATWAVVAFVWFAIEKAIDRNNDNNP